MPSKLSRGERRGKSTIDRVLDAPDSSLLDVLDHVLNKGVMATGDVTLGVAGVDLIYLRLATLLCATDRILPASADRKKRRSRHRGPSARLPR